MVHAETLQNTKNKLLWFLLACSLLLGGAGLVVATRPVPLPEPPTPIPGGVSGVAEMAVITHLVNAVGISDGRTPIAHTIAVDPAGPSRWAARVAVYDPNALRIWQVSVDTHQGVPQVVGLPALVPEPALEPVITPSVSPTGHDPQLVATVKGCLTALLTASLDLGRYISADSPLTPISPPPFVGVDVVGVSKPQVLGQDHLVMAEVKGQRRDGVVIHAQYPLSLIQRDGRWEVRGILRALPAPGTRSTQQQEGSSSND